MKLHVAEPLPTEGLLARPLHALVRDYPELLSLFLEKGIPLEEMGGAPLAEAVSVDADLLEEVLRTLRWRASRPSGSGDRSRA